MSFLNPSFLWGLLALAIPVTIHFLSKKEGKTIKVGSIKFLREADSKQSRSIQFNEFWLLLLRLLTIALLVFILAEPVIRSRERNTPLTYLLEPSLLETEAMSSLLDSLESQGEIRLLTNDFPGIDDLDWEDLPKTTPNYWQLARCMGTIKSDSIVVLTKALRKGFKGQRPTVAKNIQWITIPAEDRFEDIVRVDHDTKNARLLIQSGAGDHLGFRTELVPIDGEKIQLNSTGDSIRVAAEGLNALLPANEITERRVLLYHDTEYTSDANYLEAAFKALSSYLNQPITLERTAEPVAKDSLYDIVVWLGEEAPGVTGSNTLTYRSDPLHTRLITEGSTSGNYHLTRRLNTENILDYDLALSLRPLLNLYPGLDSKVLKNDLRTLNKAEFTPRYEDVKTVRSYANILYISKWLWLPLILIVMTERLLARYRKQ